MFVLKTVKLFHFKELDNKVQKSIIDNHIQDLPEWWSDDVEERIKNEAQAIGIEDFDFVWSGFDCQGDGLSFTGTLGFKSWLFVLQQQFPNWVSDDVNESHGFKELGESLADIVMLQENNRISWGDCVIERTTNQYYHESTVYVNEPSSSLHGGGLGRSGRVYSSDRERMESFGLKVQKHLVRWKDSLCHQWYADLEETYTAILDRENISEDIISRGQYFTASGNIIDADEIVV
tara:strand:+ start:192 stop:893 length:702 start_codon:yes stop_codon:yes gene_type:complete